MRARSGVRLSVNQSIKGEMLGFARLAMEALSPSPSCSLPGRVPPNTGYRLGESDLQWPRERADYCHHLEASPDSDCGTASDWPVIILCGGGLSTRTLLCECLQPLR